MATPSLAGRGIAEGVECIHCLDSHYILDVVETTFGEFEDVSYICHMCRKPDPTPDPTPASSRELSVIGSPRSEGGKAEKVSGAYPSGREKRVRGGIKLYRDLGDGIEWVRGDTYLVPSRSETGKRTVDLGAGSCTCPDHELGGAHCSHLIAAQIHQSKTLARLRREAAARPAKGFGDTGFSGAVDFDVVGRMLG